MLKNLFSVIRVTYIADITEERQKRQIDLTSSPGVLWQTFTVYIIKNSK